LEEAAAGAGGLFGLHLHQHFPLPLSSFIATSYHTGVGGIYFHAPDLHMRLMKPLFQREMYYNGYRWQHRTDKMGFRNPKDRDHARIVLLGDSMIYGHGVDEQHTVRHHLEALIGQPVHNLGIQGGSAHQELQILKKYALKLSPKVVVLFFLTNDIRDLWDDLTEEEMRRFLAHKDKASEPRYFDPSPLSPGKRLVSALEGFYVARAICAAVKLIYQRAVPPAAADQTWRARPLFVKRPRLKLAMDFHLRALQRMQALARANNIAFINVFIHTGQAHYADEEPVYEEVLRQFCRAEEMHFLSLRQAFGQVKERDRLFLKNDGHFTSQGAKLAAEEVGQYLEEGGLLERVPFGLIKGSARHRRRWQGARRAHIGNMQPTRDTASGVEGRRGLNQRNWNAL